MATLDYRGYTFPGYNKPIAAPRGDKHKKMVLVRKGARTKLVRYGLRGMQDYTQHGDRARRKSYLARSAGIRDKRGRFTKDDIFSANYWARRDLWAANPHQREVTGNPIMATKQSDYSYSTNDYRRKSIAELDYIIRDASEAAQAMRGMNSAAESKYLEQVADAETERARRRTTRNPRKQSYAAEFDSMMGRASFEGMMKPKDDYINLGGDRVKNDKKSILRHVQKTYPNVQDVRNDPQYGWVPVFGNPRAGYKNQSTKYLNIEKSGFYSGQFVGYGGGNVYRIQKTDTGYIAINQNQTNDYFTKRTLNEISAELLEKDTHKNPRKSNKYQKEYDTWLSSTATLQKCPICGGASTRPGGVVYDTHNKIVQGCVGDYHADNIIPGTEYARWWNRPEAKKIRAANREGQFGKGYGDNATRKNPRKRKSYGEPGFDVMTAAGLQRLPFERKRTAAKGITLTWPKGAKCNAGIAYAENEKIARSIATAIASKYGVKVTASRG